MSRLPTVGLSLATPNPKMKRLSKQTSMDLRKRKTLELPPPVPSTVVKTRSHSLVEQRNNYTPPARFCIGERIAVDSMGVVGTLKFLGEAEFKEGLWAGIQLDITGTGKNDGSVKGIRYFSCPPQTGLFVLASKVSPLDQDSDSSVPSSNSTDRHSLNTPITSPISSQRQTMRSNQVQSPTPSHYRGIPSPAMTPTHPTPDDDVLSESADERRAISHASDDNVIRLEQLQLRIEVLEAENRYLKLENTQSRSAEHILGRSIMLKGQELLTQEGHAAIVQELQDQHAQKESSWSLSQQDSQQTIEKLQAKVLDLESEQAILKADQAALKADHASLKADHASLKADRDALAHQVRNIQSERDQAVDNLESKLVDARAAVVEARATEKQWSERTLALENKVAELKQRDSSQFFQPGENDSDARQMQLEMEMVEVHEKMNTLREAARAKDIFLSNLSEQVEIHRNAVEEKEREMRRIKADADRHSREKERMRSELSEMESRWLDHRDCAEKSSSFDMLKSNSPQVEELLETIEELKRAGIESIELYESATASHLNEIDAMNAALAEERQKVARLQSSPSNQVSIEDYEARIRTMEQEREQIAQDHKTQHHDLLTIINGLQKEISNQTDPADWQKARDQLTTQINEVSATLQTTESEKARISQELDLLKASHETLNQDKANHDQQLKQLQADYDQLLIERDQYRNDLSVALDSQKQESQTEDLKKEIEQLKELLNTKQSDSSLKEENRVLAEKYRLMEESHKQVELECLKLMEEVEKLHQADQPKATEKLVDGSDAKEYQKKIDQLISNHTTELRKCREKGENDERDFKRTVAGLNHDISELEGLIESKIFKEADLEEALDSERKIVKKLQIELQDMKEDFATLKHNMNRKSFIKKSPEESSGPYCEICEIYGHDIISCKAVSVNIS